MKLLALLGHSLELFPRSYFKELFTIQLAPMEFLGMKNSDLQFSKHNQNVTDALGKQSDARRIKMGSVQPKPTDEGVESIFSFSRIRNSL